MSHPDRFLLAGIMGWPVMHSRSPVLHNYWLKKYGLTGTYVPLAIHPDKLEGALRALPALGFLGCNITIPNKERAMEIVDVLDPIARRIGAMNTVMVQPDGSLWGTNTDGYGFIEGIREEHPDWRADHGPVVVLGAGGGSRAVIVSLIDCGATEIRLLNRTTARAEELAAEIGGPVKVYPWDERADALEGAGMLVNTTSQGMIGEPPLEIVLDTLPVSALVSDLIYIPRETPLLTAARERGNRISNGLGMLLHQARPGFHAWFGVNPEVTPELRATVEATL